MPQTITRSVEELVAEASREIRVLPVAEALEILTNIPEGEDVIAAYYDGSVHRIDNSYDKDELKSLLQRLSDRLDSSIQSAGERSPEDEKPPHY